jgi:hypothetical protein
MQGTKSGPDISATKAFEARGNGGKNVVRSCYTLTQPWLSYPTRTRLHPQSVQVEAPPPQLNETGAATLLTSRIDLLEVEVKQLRIRVDEAEAEQMAAALAALSEPPGSPVIPTFALLTGSITPEISQERTRRPRKKVLQEIVFHSMATLTYLFVSLISAAAH